MSEKEVFKKLGWGKRHTGWEGLAPLIMYDILAELSMLSESLQNQETTVIYADKLIRRSVRFFEAMKENPGTKIFEAKICIREGTFNGVPLIEITQFQPSIISS